MKKKIQVRMPNRSIEIDLEGLGEEVAKDLQLAGLPERVREAAAGVDLSAVSSLRESLAAMAESGAVVRRSATFLAVHQPDEIRRFVVAVKALKRRSRAGASMSIYDELVAMHLGVVGLARSADALGLDPDVVRGLATGPGASRDGAHGGPAFLPWHRQYLRVFEAALREVDAGVSIPYWDWTDHAGTAALLSPELMGPDGVLTGSTSPVVAGPFTADQFPVLRELHYRAVDPRRPWLGIVNPGGALNRDIRPRRAPGIDTSLLATAADTERLMGRTDYGGPNVDPSVASPGFRQELESGRRLHGFGHVWIGGSMAVMSSPNDPMFWMHHANVDRLWAEWQEARRAEWEAAHPGEPYDYATHYYEPSATDDPMHGHGIEDPMWPWDGGASRPARYIPGQRFSRPDVPDAMQRALYDGLFAPFALPQSATLGEFPDVVRPQDVLDTAGLKIGYDSLDTAGT